MSQENVDALRRIYAAWAEGDFSAEGPLFDPYVVYLARRGDPDRGPHYGLEAVIGYMNRFLDNWESWRIHATDFREVGDSVIVQVALTGVGKGSQVPVEDELFHIWTHRGGRIIRVEVFADRVEALEAVGLSE